MTFRSTLKRPAGPEGPAYERLSGDEFLILNSYFLISPLLIRYDPSSKRSR